MNIVTLVMNFLAPSLVSRMASALGIENSLATKAIAAAVPSILSGLVGATSKPDGARDLANAIAKQDGGLLGNFTNMLTGAAQTSLVSGGTNMLSGLLGQSALSSLTGAVAKHAGIGDFASKTMMGMLGPVVAGVLGREQKAQGLDASGLARMLTGQKDNIASAVPQGFAKLLGGTNLFDGIASNLKAIGTDVSTTTSSGGSKKETHDHARDTKTTHASAQSSTSTSTARTVHTSGAAAPASHFSWWPWLLAIGLSSLLFYNTFVNKAPGPYAAPAAQPAATVTRPAVPGPQPLLVGNQDVGSLMAGTMDTVIKSIRGVKDEATARAALPTLQQASQRVDQLSDLSRSLPVDGRRALAGLVNSQVPAFNSAVQSALTAPNTSGILKTVLDALAAKIAALAKV